MIQEVWRVIYTRFGYVQISSLHGKKETIENLKTACFLANKLGHSLFLLARSENTKNPDAKNVTLNIFQEYKISKTSTQSSIDNALRKGAKQANHIVLELQNEISDGDLRDHILNRLARTPSIESIMIIRCDKIRHYFREQMLEVGWGLQK